MGTLSRLQDDLCANLGPGGNLGDVIQQLSELRGTVGKKDEA